MHHKFATVYPPIRHKTESALAIYGSKTVFTETHFGHIFSYWDVLDVIFKETSELGVIVGHSSVLNIHHSDNILSHYVGSAKPNHTTKESLQI